MRAPGITAAAGLLRASSRLAPAITRVAAPMLQSPRPLAMKTPSGAPRAMAP
ncbi:hypothetical protein D3C80_2055090 [compost metagenome]